MIGTWEKVEPEIYRRGDLIERQSSDCIIEQWITLDPLIPGNYICEDCGYREREISGSPYCVGYSRYIELYSQVSYDYGNVWQTTATTTVLLEANSIYCGWIPPAKITDYLTFIPLEDTSFRYVANYASDETWVCYDTLEYSIDSGTTWKTIGEQKVGTYTSMVSAGQEIWWRRSYWDYRYDLRCMQLLSGKPLGHFSASVPFIVKGNLMSILSTNSDGTFPTDGNVGQNKLSNLFGGTPVTDASNLFFPTGNIYRNGCSGMFGGCNLLKTAPNLPSTSLYKSCYSNMFTRCTSLTSAPELPAPILADSCYYEMFSGCINLNNIKCLATDISAPNCTTDWVKNVANNGTFTKAINNTSWEIGIDGIPTGWVVKNFSNYKWKGTYNDGSTHIENCDTTSSISQNEVNLVNLFSIEIGGCVDTIGDFAFSSANSLESVDMHNITTISEGSFKNCYRLTSIVIGSEYNFGNITIEGSAFENCTGLTKITVESDIPPSLGNDAFKNTNNCPIYVPCDSVNTYKNSSGWNVYADRITCKNPTTAITYISSSFLNLNASLFTPFFESSSYNISTSAGTIDFPSSVISIGDGAFNVYDNKNLVSIEIPNSVTSIGNSAFYGCIGFRNFHIPNSVISLGNYAFANCSGLTTINIPSSITSIGDGTFSGCSSLTSITIPDSVETIGNSAFRSCWNLTGITFEGTTPPTIGEGVFNNTVCPIYVPCESLDAYKTAWSNFDVILSRLTCLTQDYPIRYTATKKLNIDLTAFTPVATEETYDSTTSAGTIEFNALVKEIGSGFENRIELLSITIPESVANISGWAFYKCSGLTSVTCLATRPPNLGLGYNTFNYTNNCPIYVPAESVERYKSASVWKNYKSRIQAIP